MAPPSLFILLIAASLTLFNPSSSAAASASPPTTSPPSPPPQPPLPPPPSPSPPPPPSPSPPPPSPPSSPPPPRSRISRPSRLPPSPPSPLPPPLPAARATGQQLNNIIDALIGSGDFGSWVNIITAANPLALPLSATVFVPQNDAVSRVPAADPFLLPYHVVPQRLTFADLRLFKTNSRLPTLLPGKFIVVTSNSESNFTVDDSTITQPDVYVTANVVVHGVARVLDYSVYGVATVDSMPKPKQQQSPAPPSPPSPGQLLPAGVSIPSWKSGATTPCLCVQFPVGLMVACAVLGLRNYIW
ncbi:FAS1 domain-containing protein SELMODRAFT_448915-like [Rosa rugosa]|uniref:FAS1 domain-containing protein SELMODRAFT_448915-like n=1 Tax=Rosa rugosa TaxID=74645 RepID=UPI002B4118B4|nr:FAS1 domain-containing protein SELMODRAFT_448915-like [Rosa rugosa]